MSRNYFDSYRELAVSASVWRGPGTLDLNIAKSFTLSRSVKVSPRLEIFNLTNRSTPTEWVSQLGTRYQIPTTLQRSRLIKFELGVAF